MDCDRLTHLVLSGTSFVWRLRRRRYHRTPVKREITARRARFYTEVWQEAAEELGGSVRHIDDGLIEVRCGEVIVRCRRNLTSLDDPLTVAIAEDKPLVHRLLTERGIPVPAHRVTVANDLAAAWAFANALGGPCVVKPAGASGAIGITTDVTTRVELAWAMAYAGAFDREVVIEEMLGGGIYRLLYLDGELLDAVRRDPPTVAGDGRSTIEQLVAAENEWRLAAGIESCQSLIKIDGELRHTLRRGGRTLRSVPSAGQTVILKNIVNDNRSDDNVPATALLCPEVVEAGAEAAAAVGARLAGVDVITPDPSLPLAESGGVVLEINAAPGLYYHYYQRDGRTPVAELILRRLQGAS